MSGDTNGNLMRDANAARARRLTDAALVLPFIALFYS